MSILFCGFVSGAWLAVGLISLAEKAYIHSSIALVFFAVWMIVAVGFLKEKSKLRRGQVILIDLSGEENK